MLEIKWRRKSTVKMLLLLNARVDLRKASAALLLLLLIDGNVKQ